MCIMSEPKRANLISINVNKNKKEKPVIKSVRFNLTLTESNEKSCPIFNYRELLESATEESNTTTNGLDPFGCDDDDADVERLAKKFEAKYGCGSYSSKKKKKKYRGDWADMGAGYDETDSFIDNTDAYDEIVPQDTSPEHGGFYINSGSLAFKQQEISDMDDVSSSKSAVQKNRKRIIEDDNSDNENPKGPSIEKKLKLDNDAEKATKKIDNSGTSKSNGIKKKSVTVKELLKEKRDDVEVNGEEEKQILTKDTQNNSDKKTVLNSTSINDAIESVVNAGRDPVHDESSKGTTSSESSATGTSENTGYSDSSDDDESNKHNDNANNNLNSNNTEIIKLPDNLPEEILQIVDAIKEASKNTEGKVKFFSGSVNKKLFRLHHLCRSLKSYTKSQVYGHLASVIKCTKDTLIRRTKKIVLENYNNALEDSISRLQECVNQMMPTVIENYERECQKVNEKKAAQERESPNGEKSKPLRLPKRKFPWTDQIRKILGEVVTNKRQCYITEKNRKEKFEEHLENFYREKLIFVWPDCWMTHVHLMRESLPFLTKSERATSKYNKKSNENNPTQAQTQTKLPQTTTNPSNPQSQKIGDGTKQKQLPKVILDSINSSNKLPIPVGPPSLSIKPISQLEGNQVLKNNVKLGSGVTIEPIVSKCSMESKRTNNLTSSFDPIVALKQAMTCENLAKSQKSGSRNNSPVPPVNNPLDLNVKSKHQKSDDMKKSKTETTGNTWKLPELTVKPPSVLLDPEAFFQSKTSSKSTTHTHENSSKHTNTKEIENKKEEEDKDVEIIENVEVIEIADDDSPPPAKHTKSKSIDGDSKKRKKKKIKSDAIQTKAAEMLSQIMKEKHTAHASNPTTGSDLISKLITDQLTNYNNAVSITRKSNSEPEDKVTEPSTNISDVIQVMKDLKALEELTGQSEKSKDSNDLLSRHSNSPVSVIMNANRQSPHKSNSVSSVCKSGGGDSLGFQAVFQKHLFQDSIDCKNTSNNFSTSDGKIKISSNSTEFFPYIRSFNSASILPISTSQKYLQNLTISSCKNLSNVQSQNVQQTGAALKKDVILFPNFLYEYQLYKKTGSAQRSPSLGESSLNND